MTEPPRSSGYLAGLGFDVMVCPFSKLANLRACAKAALDGGYGLLGTTWHLLPDNMRVFPILSEDGWKGEASPRFAEEHPIRFLTDLASYCRKLVPAHGDYTAAGWSEREQGLFGSTL